MSREWTHYSPRLKDDVVSYCASNDVTHSYRSAARYFNIKGGDKLVKRWCDVAAQEQKEETRGRKRKLTVQEVKENIGDWVIEQNKAKQHVDYDIIRTHLNESIGANLSASTVKRYTHDEMNITWKEHTLVGPSDAKPEYNESIKKIRRKLQRINKHDLIFMDETNVKESISHKGGLSPAGTLAPLGVPDSSRYCPRYDVLASVCIDGPLAMRVFTPEERKLNEQKGINQEIFLDYLSDDLIPSLSNMPRRNYHFITDKASVHKLNEIQEEFNSLDNVNKIKHVTLLPTNTAKYVSPLDNCLWHMWKDRLRDGNKLAEEGLDAFLVRTWEGMEIEAIHSMYRKCRLMRGQTVDDDLI